MADIKYERILLKLSGEALLGSKSSGVDSDVARTIGSQVKEIVDSGVTIAIVVGGGNIYRGSINSRQDGIQEETGHYVGMLAITMNCLILSDLFTKMGLDNEVLSALGEIGPAKSYSVEAGKSVLEEGKVLLLAGGTGKPFCSTDTAAAIRAKELDLDLIVKMTKVDGVYDSDPMKNPVAVKFDKLSFQEALDRDLKVMDRDAFSICQDNKIPILVCKMNASNINKVVEGQNIGTIIK